MSVESLAVSSVVEGGSAAFRKLCAQGISYRDFELYDEEWKWIEETLGAKKPLSRRTFKARFPDFEYVVSKDPIEQIAQELKQERAFVEVNKLLNEVGESLQVDNAVELASSVREELGKIVRLHSPHNDTDLDSDWRRTVEEMRRGMKMAKEGRPIGLPSGFAHIDHYMGGLLPGEMIVVLGRTGEGKSLLVTSLAWAARKGAGAKVGIFTPELSVHDVRSRYHTLASADPQVQKACGLETSFKNRSLRHRRGFNIKKYGVFCEYLDSIPGRIHMLSGTHRLGGMTVGYIDDRIQELGLDLVIIDPIYLLRPVRRYKENPFFEVGSTAEAIEALCEMHNIPIVATNQSHRQGGSADAPHKDKSFGSDIPAQLADWVLGVKHISDEHLLLVRCTKARHGEEFRFDMRFIANSGHMKELTPLNGRVLLHDDEVERELEEATNG